MKYIVLRENGEELLVMFPNHLKLTHKSMVDSIKWIRVEDNRGGWYREFVDADIVSAGFVSASGHCHGRSESLNVNARPIEDTELLKSQYV